MKEIKAKVKIQGKNIIETEAILDTGSTIGIISRELAEKAGIFIWEEKTWQTRTTDKRKIKIKPAVAIAEIDGCKTPILIGVAEKTLQPLILGMVEMEMMGIKIDTQKGYTVTYTPLRG